MALRMPGIAPTLAAAVIINAVVGIILAIDPPWALWQRVGLGGVLGLAATIALYRFTRNF